MHPHGLRQLSPRTCVLEIWCRLLESNEPLSCFNQSLLSERGENGGVRERRRKGEQREMREKEAGVGGWCSVPDKSEIHLMGMFLPKPSTSLIHIQFRNLVRES